MKMEQTECSETSAYKIQIPGNYPEENIQHTEHGESLKSRKLYRNKNLGRPSRPTVIHVMFLQKCGGKKTYLTKGVFLSHLSSPAGISI
jgi:hypothetical protein